MNDERLANASQLEWTNGVPVDNLKALSGKWKAALKAGSTGPLLIAQEVIRVSEEWDSKWRGDSGGLSCNEWLRDTLGPGMGLRFWEPRARAVEELGEHVRRVLHHDVAKYVVGNVSKEHWPAVVEALTAKHLTQGHNVATEAQAKRIIARIVGKASKHRQCAMCLKLQEQVGALTAQLDELTRASAAE